MPATSPKLAADSMGEAKPVSAAKTTWAVGGYMLCSATLLIGNSDFWNEHLVGLEFRDEKKNWVITKVEWRPGVGLNTYVALYVIKGRGSDIDKKGHETQLVELFDPKSFPYFTKRRVTRLGLYDKYLELQKRRAEGSN